MRKVEFAKTLGAMIVGGVFALGGVAANAAENAAGVKEHMDLTVKTTKEAMEAAKAGNESGCLASIKQAKQHYKEITGDAAGKPLQDAMKRMKEAQAECEKEGGAAAGAAILAEVVASMEKIQANIK
jgi:hypothetical protein